MVNTGTLIKLGALVAFVSLANVAVAQSDIALKTRKGQLLELAESLKVRDAVDRQHARAIARQLGIPKKRSLPGGSLLELQRIAPGIGPVFYITNNYDAADTVSTDNVWPGGVAGLALDGNGLTIGEWDGGAVFAAHPDLAGRVNQADGVTGISEHSTHVAGTLVGAGADPFYPQARGMAYAASLEAYDWNSDTAEMALAAADGMLVSNHSYGIAAGWLYLGDVPPDTWWWIGGADPSDTEDANFGYYDTEAHLWDQIAWDAPYYLIVKAGGNDRWDIGPLPGEEYTVIDQDGNFLFTSTLPRSADCAPAGYDCLPGQSVAKNILTVGAVDDLNEGYAPLAGSSQVQMTGFSGWGPSDDGRIKPDLVGNGMWLVSTWPDAPGYAAALGTSMATPNVSGSLLLLQEHYENVNGVGNFMRAATLKALAIHTTDEAGPSDGPDYAFGWGLMNTATAARVISENGGDHRIVEDSLVNGVVNTVEISVPEPDSVVTVTLVWTDPPGVPVTPALDPQDLMLVNDLDLRLAQGPSNWLPWVLDPSAPSAPATRGDNFRDNVEQVVAQVSSAGSYFAEVRHKGTLSGGEPQDYSLIISVEPAPPEGATSAIDEDFSDGMPGGWTVDTVRGVAWTIRTPLASDEFYDNLTGGAGKFAMVPNFFENTLTSLRTPVLDLSSATDVILNFDSSFRFSDLEDSINVDISTDGGGTWLNVWKKIGLLGFPAHYVLDLTGELSGQALARLRFRYDTSNILAGYYWQIDNVKLDAFGTGSPPPTPEPPAAASNLFPADGEVNVSLNAKLNWTAGSGAELHDVYFGTTSPPALQATQGGTGFNPGPLHANTTYYWRVDEINDGGTTPGSVWSFTTEEGPSIPVTNIHLAGIDGVSTPGSRNRWTATVNVRVTDSDNVPVSDALMEGSWSGGTNGGASCTTNTSGQCSVSKPNLKGNVTSVVFTVSNLAGAELVHDTGADTSDNPVTVFKDAPPADQAPTASADHFETTKNGSFSDNVLDNDDRGQPEANVSGHDAFSDRGVSIAVLANGDFTYTPPTDFVGTDTFGYTIANSEGSDTAQVTVQVADVPVGDPLTLTASIRRQKGNWFVDLAWTNGTAGGTVSITRNSEPIASDVADDGVFTDDLGKKPGGSYSYEVCENDTGECARDSVSF